MSCVICQNEEIIYRVKHFILKEYKEYIEYINWITTNKFGTYSQFIYGMFPS